ncbi:MAG: efflux RND transporter permease subunit [Armatimonadetes bacterium]|nr:efflux RND transporter permease subunit [Armatimonadota bacterium]MDE2205173.1 efflux RND transporter permease subunit [Armatimonadota bacterium]
MNISTFATRHIKAIVFATLVLCFVGAAATTTFPISILPDVTFPRIMVLVDVGEQPISVVDVQAARPLEEAIATVPGVRHIRTRMERGGAEISVDFNWGTDMASALQLVYNQINIVRAHLPAGSSVSAERMNPTVFPILGLSLESRRVSPAEMWTYANYTLRPILARVPGVARAVVQGGAVPEMAVDVNPARAAAFGLSLPEIEQAIAASNQVQAVGRVNRQYQQMDALVSSLSTTPDQLGRIVVAQRGGIPISLSMVAHVYPSVQDATTIVTANGHRAVLMNIVRQPAANTVQVADAVRAQLAQMKSTLPAGTSVGVFYDQSKLVNEAIGSVRDAVLIGAGLAVIVLLMFLGNIRATLVTAAIIPSTVLITFLLMRLVGLTLNLMTLGAMAVGTGLVIDDAIVVVENVFRHLAHNEQRVKAVQTAASEIAPAMISSTLTVVVVFLPLVLLTGIEGAFFSALAITLVLALITSLFLALLVSPSLCAAFLHSRSGGHEHGPLFERLLTLYERVLDFALRRRWVVAAFCGVLLASTVWLSGRMKTGFMPEMDEGAFILDYVTPPGTSLAESNRVLMQIEAILRQTPDVQSFSRRTGTELGFAVTEPNSGDFAVTLKQGHRRPIDDVIASVRKRIAAQVPGVDVDFSQVLQDLIGDLAGAPAPMQVKLYGPDQQQLVALANQVETKIRKIDGIADVKTSAPAAGPQLVFHVNPDRAGRVGLTPDAVAAQVNAAMFGDVATQILSDDKPMDVRVRYADRYRNRLDRIEELPIRTPGGEWLPLADLATVRLVPGTTEQTREDQRRLVSVDAQLSGRDLGSVSRDVTRMMNSTPLPNGVRWELGGQYKSQQRSFKSLAMVLGLAIVLVFAVMLFKFGEFTLPIVILSVMPLCLFGVMMALWLTGTPFNVSSFMGAIMLVGIVVKNGILLLDQAQRAERDGASPREAIARAGQLRLRPILMTTLADILGLAPLALGIGAGAEMQQPLAIAVIGGLSLSMLLNLVVAPTLYTTMREVAAALSARRQPVVAAD